MIIACPRCGTSYEVRDDLFGGQGRSVQCSACACRWRQPPSQLTARERELESVGPDQAEARTFVPQETREQPERWPPRDDLPIGAPAALPPQEPERAHEKPPAAPEEETPAPAQPETAAPAANETSQPEAAAPGMPEADPLRADLAETVEPHPAAAAPLDQEATGRTEAVASRRRKAGRTTSAPARGLHTRAVEIIRRPPVTAATAALATFFTLSALLIVLRAPIVSALPSAAGVYGLFGLAADPLGAGLEIREIESARELHGGEDVLRVMGVVANVTDSAQSLPSIRVSLFNDKDEELQFTTLAQQNKNLAPGEVLSFDAKIIEPRPEARRIRVGFVAGDP